ncbi:MAG TPA: hypothetical protein VHV08_13455 [Pirellulales bacterium]|nr:hypothetical protein [Pirellulales bacterium]
MAEINRQLVLIAILLLVTPAFAADVNKTAPDDVKALASVQTYVGEWRGVGQLKRGSNQGAWTEESSWAWYFHEGRAALRGELKRDKYYGQLEIQAGEKPGQFVLLATPIDKEADASALPQRFTGTHLDGALVFTAAKAQADRPTRISLRLVAAGDRMLVLYEQRLGEGIFARLAEVGSTRKGSSFAKATTGGPECVVTGGLGKIPVQYQGQTYYVCCTGCRDLFRDDPAGVLEEYRRRKAAEAVDAAKDR